MNDKNIENRIWFKNNPWPDGHAIEDVKFYGVLKADCILLYLSIKSEQYYTKEGFETAHEKALAHDDDCYESGITDDWQLYGGWLNYHACHIQPNNYVVLGDTETPFAMSKLSGLTLNLDDPPPRDKNWGGISFDDLSFHCYVLGHDAVGHHNISFKLAQEGAPNHYDVDWVGKVALAYMGDDEFKYDFKIKLRNVPFMGFDGLARNELRHEGESVLKKSYWYDTRQDRSVGERESELREWATVNTTIPASRLKFTEEEHSDWLKFVST